jgi:cyclic lactone autoinducer peptide
MRSQSRRKEDAIMKHLLIRCGTVLCTIAVVVTRFGVLSCRGRFYQPEEPAGLKNFLEKGEIEKEKNRKTEKQG